MSYSQCLTVILLYLLNPLATFRQKFPQEGTFIKHVVRVLDTLFSCVAVFDQKTHFRLFLKFLRIAHIHKLIELCSFLDDSKYIY